MRPAKASDLLDRFPGIQELEFSLIRLYFESVVRRSIEKRDLVDELHGEQASLLDRYRSKVYSGGGLLALLRYEMSILLCGEMAGGLGYFLRRRLYGGLFARIGRQPILGKGLTLRHPHRMFLGERVAIDDYVLLDAGGAGREGVVLGDNIIISRHTVIQAKYGPVRIGNSTDIGSNCVLSSVSGIFIGRSVLIAGNCYIGGGRYRHDRLDVPMLEQGVYSKGPVTIEDDVWLGAGSVVLDGITVGKGSIVGAGAVVTKDIPCYSVAVGAPACVVKKRQEGTRA